MTYNPIGTDDPPLSRVHELARMTLTGLVQVWNGLNDQRQAHGPSVQAVSSCGDRDRIIAAIRNLEDPREYPS